MGKALELAKPKENFFEIVLEKIPVLIVLRKQHFGIVPILVDVLPKQKTFWNCYQILDLWESDTLVIGLTQRRKDFINFQHQYIFPINLNSYETKRI